MDQQRPDHRELRPFGEDSSVIDPELEGKYEDAHRIEPSSAGNSIQATQKPKTKSNCRSCGVSIPSNRSKCLFCLTERIEPPDETTAASAENLLSVIFITVTARTHHEAIAKGTAGCRKLVSDDGPIDGYQLVDDIDEPAPQLVDRWASLPSAASLDSEAGEQFLEQLEDIVDKDIRRWSTASRELPILYDEWGDAVDDSKELSELEESQRWFVPALGLYETSRSNQPTKADPNIPSKTQLVCRHCEEETIHGFEVVILTQKQWSLQYQSGSATDVTPLVMAQPRVKIAITGQDRY
ncbi:hypothetical protein JMJ58_21150 (plasmid) [Haloterrigena salifodinae]|uniref:DUF7995 domain-containing protein n=1 Tax=Haloterrigena salifodinae TaxID=2675099 RepID=A0A8T8E6H6_9EURY|nr:hypothetical protein [Haloterrigena salifodinae]QRV17464.1 hypothetical protein JMJ58_21150 [Haloterrigena salifodinae]